MNAFWRQRPVFKWTALSAVGLLVAIVIAASVADWNALRRPIARIVGVFGVVIPHGQVRALFVEFTGIDVSRSLGLVLTKNQQKVELRCGVAKFQVEQGQLNAKTMVLDTATVLTPIGAILAFVDPGPAKDANSSALVAQAAPSATDQQSSATAAK